MAMDRSVLKALAVLDALGASSDGKLLTELAAEVGFPISTTHRLLATLASRDYVVKDGLTGRYLLGSKILRLQAVTANRLHLARTAFPLLRKLVQQVDETANLATLSDSRVVYLESVAADRAVGLYAPPGTIAPAHCTAMGKLLLAYLPEDELTRWLNQNDLFASTPNTITEPAALEEQLAQIRVQQIALDNEEWVQGVHCIAGPIRDYSGKVVAAVSVSAPNRRLSAERESEVIETVKRICAEISERLGHR